MERDILDLNVGTLDVIIYAALRLVALPARSFSDVREGVTLDAICELNARDFVDEFIGQPIHAITILREASGLSLLDCKAAWEQTLNSYYGEEAYHRASAKRAEARGELDAMRYHIQKM